MTTHHIFAGSVGGPYASELSTSPPYKTLRYLKSGQVLATFPGGRRLPELKASRA